MSLNASPPSLVSWGELNGNPAKLESLVAHPSSPFFGKDEFVSQLRNIANHAVALGANGLAVESRYVDRDFVEDHSLYYSKSLHAYQNFCKRVHFFRGGKDEIQTALDRLARGHVGKPVDDYRKACLEFSKAQYLGFSVIRPLPGSPVGRTVLRPPTVGDDVLMPGVKEYVAHFLGVELRVTGLAFQQQDLGVSACATTAIWSSMQKMRDFEDIASFSPATITTLAARFSLPFGRMLPAEEGLNIDQMCQAIQAIGVSPSLFRVHHVREARLYLHTAIRSGYVPIVIAHYGGENHATAVTGMTLGRNVLSEDGESVYAWQAESSRLTALFLHDDRIGPYTQATLVSDGASRNQPQYKITGPKGEETWKVTHILVPHHPKIRLSFAGLKRIVTRILTRVTQVYELVLSQAPTLKSEHPQDVVYEQYVERSYRYIESLVLNGEADQALNLWNTVPLPRYAGVVRVSASYLGQIDILIDTTDTDRNVRCLGIIARGKPAALTRATVDYLRAEFIGR